MLNFPKSKVRLTINGVRSFQAEGSTSSIGFKELSFPSRRPQGANEPGIIYTQNNWLYFTGTFQVYRALYATRIKTTNQW